MNITTTSITHGIAMQLISPVSSLTHHCTTTLSIASNTDTRVTSASYTSQIIGLVLVHLTSVTITFMALILAVAHYPAVVALLQRFCLHCFWPPALARCNCRAALESSLQATRWLLFRYLPCPFFSLPYIYIRMHILVSRRAVGRHPSTNAPVIIVIIDFALAMTQYQTIVVPR